MSTPRFSKATARCGEPTLRLETAAGGWWVHSAVDPRREAMTQLDRLAGGSPALLVVAGGGLGWLARLAMEDPRFLEVLVLEPPGRQGRLELAPEARVLAGGAAELVAAATRRQVELGLPPLAVAHNPAYGKGWPAWLEELARRLPPGRAALTARRHAGAHWPPRRVLLPDSGYYLVREVREALAVLGIEVLRVPLRRGVEGESAGTVSGTRADADYAGRMVEAALEGAPDLLLTINHLGLDRDGRLQELFDGLGVPVASWFVDSPEFILEDAPVLGSPTLHLFCWERAWIPWLRSRGAGHVEHLPLAGSLSFRREADPRVDFSFVAGSNGGALRKWTERLACPARLRPELDDLLAHAAEFPRLRLPGDELEASLAAGRWPGLAAWSDPAARRRLASLLVLRATREDRRRLASAFAGEHLVLHGDADWRALLPNLRVGPPLDYYRGLADHYREARISLSTTSRQMPGTVNQRLFDAPLAGSLVLTDRPADLEELFEPGRELLAWTDPDDALEQGKRALRDDARRRAMVENARRRISSAHLYTHRLERLLACVGAARPCADVVPIEREIPCASW